MAETVVAAVRPPRQRDRDREEQRLRVERHRHVPRHPGTEHERTRWAIALYTGSAVSTLSIQSAIRWSAARLYRVFAERGVPARRRRFVGAAWPLEDLLAAWREDPHPLSLRRRFVGLTVEAARAVAYLADHGVTPPPVRRNAPRVPEAQRYETEAARLEAVEQEEAARVAALRRRCQTCRQIMQGTACRCEGEPHG